MITELDQKILETVLQAAEPVPSWQIALNCNVSINTIRNEISVLNQEIAAQGICIKMKRSVGIYLEILDDRPAKAYLRQMKDSLIRNKRLQENFSERVYDIARAALSVPDGLTVERLATALYISRGTALSELKNVRELLKPFHLTLNNRRGGHGLTVEGSEWEIRQCLIYLHKKYKIAYEKGSLSAALSEKPFARQFFMDGISDPMDNRSYDELSALFQQEIVKQKYFSLPTIHFPKIVNMILLCASRKKQMQTTPFTEPQREELQATREYGFVRSLLNETPAYLRTRGITGENESLMLTALLLGFEDQNYCLSEFPRGRECIAKAQSFAEYLLRYFDYDANLIDESFFLNISSSFYRLENQRRFGVINDAEATGGVQRMGISTGNLCLAFARFFEENYGYSLSHRDALDNFYTLNTFVNKQPRRFYMPRVLVISEFGISCAEAVASRLRLQYEKEVQEIRACSIAELLEERADGYDLLLTDMSHKKVKRYLHGSPTPVLSIEFSLPDTMCPELDIWLGTHREAMEKEILNETCFRHVDIKNKEELFAYIVSQYGNEKDFAEVSLLEELRRNDRLFNEERENRLVFLPILLTKAENPRIVVIINRRPFVWNENSAQIFVFYTHPCFRQQERVLSQILSKLLHMPLEVRTALLENREADPMLLFYPNE